MDHLLKEQIFDEICDALGELMDKKTHLRDDIQPTESVLDNAARAAVQVIEAFELGYRMGE